MDPNLKLSSSEPLTEEQAASLLAGMAQAPIVYAALDTPGQPGFIVWGKESVTLDDGSQKQVYDDVLPILLKQHEGIGETLSFPSFDAAIDEYFSKFEEQRLAAAADAAEKAIKQKVEHQTQRRNTQSLQGCANQIRLSIDSRWRRSGRTKESVSWRWKKQRQLGSVLRSLLKCTQSTLTR